MTAIPVARPLVVFKLDGQRYALELVRVRECLRVVAVTPLPGAPAGVLGAIDLRGVVVPVIELRRRFDHPARSLRLTDQLIIADTGRRIVALLVDEATGVLEATAETCVPASEILPGLDLVAGTVALADGLILIHDLERLLSLEDDAAIDRALEASATHAGIAGSGPRPPTEAS
ncbi:MAG: chemotaxis protein CheW [Thermoanaerobaculia bacterium]